VSRIEREITKMNPNPISFYDELKGAKADKVSRWEEWLQKDPELFKIYMKEMNELEVTFQAKKWALHNLSKDYINDPYVLKQVKKSLRKMALSK